MADDLITRVVAGDVRAIARTISLLEDGDPRAKALRGDLFIRGGQAIVVGVTGSPGAGKSTLVDQLAAQEAGSGHKVAIVAVDPSSPFSGGAVLGDRIRMNRAVEHPGVYIRSMATRGALGGLARSTIDAIAVLDAAGFNRIFIETVGVGQAEIDVARIAHTCLVVLVPGMGDSVQAIKAGILEIADIFVINKADREGADQLQKELRTLLSLAELGGDQWEPAVQRTVATTGDGCAELVSAIARHEQWFKGRPAGRRRAEQVMAATLLTVIAEEASSILLGTYGATVQQVAASCVRREISFEQALLTLKKLLPRAD